MYGDGSIFLTKNNGNARWAYRWRQGGKSHTKFFPGTEEGKRLATAFKKVMRTELQRGIKGGHQKLHDAMLDYLRDYKLGKIRQSSYNRSIDTLFAIPKWLRNKQLKKIVKDDINKALNETGLSKSSKAKMYDLIKATMKNAVDNFQISESPCKELKRPKVPKSPKSVFTTSEVFRMLRTIHYIQNAGKFHSIKHDYYVLFKLLLHGLRIGEALGLRWTDFSWIEGDEKVHIQRTLDSHFINTDKAKKGLQLFNPPKTISGDRWVPLMSKDLIKRLKEMRPSEDATGQVFATVSGTALSYHNFIKTWFAIGREYARKCPHCNHKRPSDWYCSKNHHVNRNALTCKECGEERPQAWTCPVCGTVVTELHKNIHTCRHTFVSHYLNHGVSVKVVQAWIGDADSSVVMDVYGHAPENLRRAVKEQFRK